MIGRTNTGGGSGNSASLTVNAPAGAIVTVSKDGRSKTKVARTDGVAVFKGLVTGQWTLTITDGERTRSQSITITADYSTTIAFFSATIHVTYPAGSTCTAKNGTTTLTAPNTSGTWDCVVPNAGTWTVECTDGEQSTSGTVTITSDGQTENLTLTYFSATIHITYPAGSTCTATDGVTTLTAPDTSGTWDCVVPNAGTWTVSLDSGLAETIDVTTSGETYTIDRWYLYNQGDEHEAITGGWTGTGLTKNADNLYLKGDGVYCQTANGVSTLGYASAVFEAMSQSTTSGGKSYVGFLDDRGAEVAKVQVTPGSEKKVVQVPLDAVQGTFKPYLWTQAYSKGAYLYSVYLTI